MCVDAVLDTVWARCLSGCTLVVVRDRGSKISFALFALSVIAYCCDAVDGCFVGRATAALAGVS